MPKVVEEKIRKTAERLARQGRLRRKKGESLQESIDRYVYGTMGKHGLMNRG
jgi:hypothetical protein